jgi:hypothetical protein
MRSHHSAGRGLCKRGTRAAHEAQSFITPNRWVEKPR